MARLAGRKKDAAWMRMNKFVRTRLTSETRSTLVDLLEADAEVSAGVAAYLTIIASAGVATDKTASDFIENWCAQGFPREVWFGYTRFDTYAKPTGKDYYAPVHGAIVRQGANSLRAIVSQYARSVFMLSDLTNTQTAAQGNPGGKVDGHLESHGL